MSCKPQSPNSLNVRTVGTVWVGHVHRRCPGLNDEGGPVTGSLVLIAAYTSQVDLEAALASYRKQGDQYVVTTQVVPVKCGVGWV